MVSFGVYTHKTLASNSNYESIGWYHLVLIEASYWLVVVAVAVAVVFKGYVPQLPFILSTSHPT